ncbi:cation:proton antiporter [Methylovorus menthalis]|uniref:cation:proton antiporter n=1 Tax=Methylovorus menthalis TaxID=1002227 RepID=UPI001E2A7BBD|nr:cation:proton antiporter [Methylovorus menthalis]MCB4811934.1 cation:proton antiporter [Methylovorus menthalis]
MHALSFIQDLAVIMLVAGFVTVVFQRIKQPVVLGYILAGLIIGPHTPPWPLIHNQETVETLAELGIVFLMFSLGLEFNLRKLQKVGATAFVAAITEIVVMVCIGYEIGQYFGWKVMDSIFLGAMLAISSTTIIVKALEELGMKRERFAQLIFGILIVEDILAIGIIALLSGMAATGTVSTGEAVGTIGKLVLFMVVSLVVGILVVPRLLDYVASFKRHETLLVSVLGLLFGFCLLVIKMDYSIALGAFMIGAIMAEAKQIRAIERLIEPVRDMFSAIFFVTIGLMLDPNAIVEYAVPIMVISAAVILGKIISCGTGTLLAGNDGRTSLRVGMGLAQIGEFSFIIATLGLTLNVTSHFLYPIAVATSVVTTLLTPYLIRAADPLSNRLTQRVPGKIARFFDWYQGWLQGEGNAEDRALLASLYRKLILQIFVNVCLVAALFVAGRHLLASPLLHLPAWAGEIDLKKSLIWGSTLLLSAPFLIAAFRKLQAFSLLLADHATQTLASAQADKVRRIISRGIPAISLAFMTILLLMLSWPLIPSLKLTLAVAVIVGLLFIILRRWFVRMHYLLQISLLETLNQKKDEH